MERAHECEPWSGGLRGRGANRPTGLRPCSASEGSAHLRLELWSLRRLACRNPDARSWTRMHDYPSSYSPGTHSPQGLHLSAGSSPAHGSLGGARLGSRLGCVVDGTNAVPPKAREWSSQAPWIARTRCMLVKDKRAEAGTVAWSDSTFCGSLAAAVAWDCRPHAGDCRPEELNQGDSVERCEKTAASELE